MSKLFRARSLAHCPAMQPLNCSPKEKSSVLSLLVSSKIKAATAYKKNMNIPNKSKAQKKNPNLIANAYGYRENSRTLLPIRYGKV